MNVSAAGTTAPYTFDTARQRTLLGHEVPAEDLHVYRDRSFYHADLREHDHLDTPDFAGPVIDDMVITAAPNVVKARVWHTWTGGPAASAPAIAEPGWHPTNGDPQSKVHKYENHNSASRTTSPTTATRAAALGSSG